MENNTLLEMLRQENADLKIKLKGSEEHIVRIQKDAEAQVLKVHAESGIKDMLKDFLTVYDSLPEASKVEAVNSLVNTELSNQNAEFYLDEKGHLNLRRKDGTALLSPNHKQVDPVAFLESVLSQNRIIVSTKEKAKEKEKQQEDQKAKYSQLKELAKTARVDYETSTQHSPLQ